MDPIISAQCQNGEKYITVYDSKQEIGQTYKIPATKADEFIRSRNQKIGKTNQKIGILSTVLAAIGGLGSYVLCKNAKESGLFFKTALGAMGGAIIGAMCIGPFMRYHAESKADNEFIKQQ